MRLLNRLTIGAALAATAGLGVFGAVSASTIPGITTTSSAATQRSGVRGVGRRHDRQRRVPLS
jgi:hypothetical protein